MNRHPRFLAPLLLLLVAGGGWFVDLAAQEPPKKKLPKPEVEDPNPPTQLKPVRDPEKDLPPAKTIPTASDLAAAARQTKHPVLQQFFSSIAYPHDIMTMRQSGETRNIEPIAEYVGNRPRFKGMIKTRRLGPDWLPTTTLDISASEIAGIEPYERVVMARVERFLKEGYDKLPEKDYRYLSRSDMLQAAAQALTAVVGFHESARARGARVGGAWAEVEAELRQKLLGVELEYLNSLARAGDWEAAAATARRLTLVYQAPLDQEQIARPLIELIDRGMKSGRDDDMREAQRRLQVLQGLFRDLKSLQGVSEGLRGRAEQLFEYAKTQVKKGQLKDALNTLREAERLYPQLPDLHDYRLRLEKQYPILRVGVRDLPVTMAPGLACTDAERYAVELLFEGLVKLISDPEAGQRYEPALAEGRPKLVPMGRQFQLARNAFWSADRRITAADVRGTVRLLKDPEWPGYRPSWAELVEDVQLGGDPFQVSLYLRQGFLDPLSLMTFKILPPEVNVRNLAEFARQPAGSGPYQYRGQETADGRRYARFLANPNYGARAGKRGLPHIREIHFVKSDDPVRDFERGLLDLLLDVPPKKVQDLAAVRDVTVPPPLPNRRVYFLAVNHRRPALQNQELRRALGLAVPREKLLDEYFRSEPGKAHRALNGPYPAGSWACDPTIPPLDRLDQAKALIKAAEKKGSVPRKLTLKFPNDDPAAAAAMAFLCGHLTNELGIEVVPEPTEPHALREAVELTHTYELAYYHYDYPSEAYWLWPLFDPRGLENGGNYLGYANDAELERWFREAMGHRHFPKVQEYTRLIHGAVESKMLLIPLWQLDTVVALHRNLKPTALDPLTVFTDIEHWRLDRR